MVSVSFLSCDVIIVVLMFVATLTSNSNAFTQTNFLVQTRIKNAPQYHAKLNRVNTCGIHNNKYYIRHKQLCRRTYVTPENKVQDANNLEGKSSSTTTTNDSALSSLHNSINIGPSQQRLNTSSLTATVSNSSAPVHNHVSLVDDIVIASFIVSSCAGIAGLLKLAGPGSWRYFVAGGICAATSHALVTPIDVVKTRKQVDPVYQDEPFIKTTLTLVRKEGMAGLLAGLGPTAFGYLLEGAVKFGVYEVLKPISRRLLSRVASLSSALTFLDSRISSFILSGSVAGVAASLVLCPMEALRIRMVAEPDFAPRGWIHGLIKMLKYEGVFGLWKGSKPMMLKQVPYTVTKNVSFDLLAKLAYATVVASGYAAAGATKVAIPLFSAFFASMLSTISSQPGDMLLSLINAHEGERRTRDFANDILKSESGLRGFFVGIKARFLHVGIMVTLQLMIYDVIKRACGIAATGSV